MKKKNFKKGFIIIGILVIFLIGVFVGNVVTRIQEESKASTTQSTKISQVEAVTKTIENTLTSSGEMLSSSTEKLTLTTTKYFKTMCVEEDDIVSKGENILQYSDGTYLTASYDCLIDSYSVPTSGSICTSSNYVQVQNLETMNMQISINESDINKIEKGKEVEIQVSAINDKTYTGTITSIDNAGTYSSSGTTFSAIIQFANDGNVKIGMSATCSIILEKAENCVAIPINAVQTKDDQKYVVVVNDDGTTKNVNVQTGISDDSYVQVTEGLSVGEKVQMVEVESTTSNKKKNTSQKNNNQRSDMSQMGGQMGVEMPKGDFGGPPSN